VEQDGKGAQTVCCEICGRVNAGGWTHYEMVMEPQKTHINGFNAQHPCCSVSCLRK
jgi:hypothetical protein